MLAGKRVLDLSWVLGGPFAGQLLAQLGADVIKVETPEGDTARRVPPITPNGDSPFFLSVNRGKRSIAINLKSEDGKAAFCDLVREVDAVIYGFAPSVPKRLGLDFETLSGLNPRIVVGQLIGLHDEGEYANAPAFDLMLQAMSGLMSITGEQGRQPVRVGYQVADLAGGLYLALGTVAGLCRAQSTGKGELVQVSLFDTQVAMMTWQAQGWLCGGPLPQASGARHAMIAPSDIFQAADGKWIALAPTGEHFWRTLCEAIGKPQLAEDNRFCNATVRIENVQDLTRELAEIIARQSSSHWKAIFDTARVPAAVVLNVEEALAHPVVHQRNMVEPVKRVTDGATVPMLGNPFKFSNTPTLGYPPSHGADTDRVLLEVGRYSQERIDELHRTGAIGKKSGVMA
ncbi:CaiB/BaiF CoA transferase family protein [Cupriavidus necator]